MTMLQERHAQVRTVQRAGTASSGNLVVQIPIPSDAYRVDIGSFFFYRDSGSGERNSDHAGDPAIRARFFDLADWWRSDTDAGSFDRDAQRHPAYRRIIEQLGTAAIPLMLEDLKNHNGHWFDALRQLSGENVDAHASGSMRRAREAWLRWGEAKGHIA